MMVLVWMVGVALVRQVPPPKPPDASVQLRTELRGIRETEAKQIRELADRLARDGKEPASRTVLAGLAPLPSRDGATRLTRRLEVIPPPPPLPGGTVPEAWRSDLKGIREQAGDALFRLAGRAGSQNVRSFALADECLRGVAERLPDHAEARRLLGYVTHQGGWATPFAIRQLRKDMVLDDKFGWVDRSWIPHLKRGELPGPPIRGQNHTRWLPADEADALHQPMANGWKISTEHFVIQTDVSLSEAIEFGRNLEAFHDLFFAILADLFAGEDRLPLAQRFHDKKMTGERTSEPHVVYYFSTKSEYVEALTHSQGPSIAETLGIYLPPDRTIREKRGRAYFYRDPNGPLDMTATLYHEVSHQLLFESAGPSEYKKNVGQYWVFEGLGTYFETFILGPDTAMQVGGLVGPRIAEAQRKSDENEFAPIERLVQFDQERFNDRETIFRNYAQSMALTVFLMQSHEEGYRPAFLEYVKNAYRGRLRRDTGRSLSSQLGVPYDQLDAELQEYLGRK